jgi:uncharacterized protein YndB with AHSA1/START domain
VENETTLERIGDCELLITRTFSAPPELVFDAWTRPEWVRRWWAPKSHGVSVIACDADVRVGGRYRYVLGRETQELVFSGEYREVTPPSRLVYTQRFEPMPGEVLVAVTFEGRGKMTHLISREVYPSKAALEGALAVGMEHGMRETFEQLEALFTAPSR